MDAYVNLLGDARQSGREWLGWAWGDTSIQTEHGTHEVTGGRIVVWAPDDRQFFPTQMGPDSRLFTADDPVGPIPAGWTVIDLSNQPFAQIRAPQVDVSITHGEWEPLDLSQLPIMDAYDRMIDLLKARYPMQDARPIDWDGLREQHRAAFEAAAASGDEVEFWIALNRFLVDLDTWGYFAVYPFIDDFLPRLAGTTGVHVDVTDDDRVIVISVDPGSSAAQAGIGPGAEIKSWDGLPGIQAIDAIPQFFTMSSPQNIRLIKTEWFGAGTPDAEIAVVFRNPGEPEQTATLTVGSARAGDVQRDQICVQAWRQGCRFHPPITLEMLPSGLALIWIWSFGFDAQEVRILLDTWNQIIAGLSRGSVPGIVIDVRHADVTLWGAVPLYLSGSFFSEGFPVAEQTAVDAVGASVYNGTYRLEPNPNQWTKPVAILVDAGCKGGCELFVQAMSHLPSVVIAGMSNTGGGIVVPYQPILLPEENFVTTVEFAFRDPATHDLIIEGTGIALTLRVPRTPETLVATVANDPLRDAAEAALLALATSPIASPAAESTPAP